MIIVSQDKDEIINFNNVISINIFDVWDDKPGQLIAVRDTSFNRHVIGYFKKDERAKEILRDIFDKIVDGKNIYKIPED